MGAKKKSSSLKKSSSKEFSKGQSHQHHLLTSPPRAKGPPPPAAITAASRRSDAAFSFNLRFALLVFLWVCRVCVVFCPQNGYIQPDEFFQFTEPIAGDVFGVESLRVWEFNRTAPLRNMFFPSLFSLPIFKLLKSAYWAEDQFSFVPAYFLLIGPRLLMTFASFWIDFCIFRLCSRLYSPSPSCKSLTTAKTLDCLLAHASSYLAFTYYTHTFSNTIETILFGQLLITVIESTRNGSSPICTYIKLSLIIAFGFFNRPTFTVFAFIPTLYWLATYSPLNQSKSASKLFRASWSSWASSCTQSIFGNSLKLAIPFTLTSISLILIDTGYHIGFDDLLTALTEFSFTKLTQSIALTPVNFLLYNLQTENLANHGLHPIWFHSLVCMPWMFTLLAFIFYFDVGMKVKSHISSKFTRITVTNPTVAILYWSILFSVFAFSTRPHHEPRFLLPLIIPLVCLFGYRLFSYQFVSWNWMLINLLLTLFYGHVHQAGVVPGLMQLQHKVVNVSGEAPVTFIFARQYLPPYHLLTISKRQSERFQIIDLSIRDFPATFEENLKPLAANREIYLSLPSCLTHQLKQSLTTNFSNVTLDLFYTHFPHFTTEDLEHSISTFKQLQSNANDENISTNSTGYFSGFGSQWTRVRYAFSLNIWKLTFN